MRLLDKASIGLRLLLAFLVVLGTSENTLASLICSAGAVASGSDGQSNQAERHSGGTSAVQSAFATESIKPHNDRRLSSSRTHEGGNAEKSGCCCEMKSGEPAEQPAQALPSTLVPIFVALLPTHVLGSADAMSNRRQHAVYFYAGDSPPTVKWHPDFGRAPPQA